MLGRAKRVLITEHATTIIEGAGDPALIDLRCRELRAAIEREKHLSYDREQLQQRLARLAGGIAVIKVGGATESAIAERKERATGAASAVRAAARGGIVIGGGAALVHAGKALRELARESLEQRAAINAVGRAVLAPARRIAENAGADGRHVVARLLAEDDPGLRLRRGAEVLRQSARCRRRGRDPGGVRGAPQCRFDRDASAHQRGGGCARARRRRTLTIRLQPAQPGDPFGNCVGAAICLPCRPWGGDA